ncbi:amino acid adenylation domain-containing protein [Corynebacterium sp. 320]|uniref:Pls/PosA family non-ribosomal peptide synthetase n=1 Tax=Corynebacterium TaxID=1716 RepID=UPI00125CC191|nr:MULTISPECIES: Pls/PosA family non-ribosomal peptide synthetase [Corynebacterium]KAB1503072.1 amino acid adenylation domain-containing protein [Corynebacterium sp. 320]KAB1551076.1 amino acid adenylation domain-containing protein [Corynebacterium sp. 319]KAB3526869.1 amino acid adenylation domain-containing protein [Corynebacterium sp. 250]KAB3538362.1 amino acid adenylation domain-containing protein [Corynebacterium sp. 366]QNP92516.1 amino acid adenylation domain-containing protein [Coryne
MDIPAHYLRSSEAPEPRTLVDIFRATADTYPDAAALDDGNGVLTYSELLRDVHALSSKLASQGIRRGDRVGIRMPSGSRELYIAILATLHAGAAYVPVDADDPQERADLVFGEAQVDALCDHNGLTVTGTDPEANVHDSADDTALTGPTTDSDAWIIFTSGSTGTPKGVAVTHRNAAAFVDAEAELFLVNHPSGPLGPGDRVLAGLSVAFDASCEEMWLAWRHGACLVPAPRALVRSGVDLGPWLISHNITAISTVPTLASLWPDEALDAVRLLIFGGEACPDELAGRLATPSRELWNTYGPTEATVVACGTTMDGRGSVSIGLPLRGWDLGVVDQDGNPVNYGEVGELVIGGVGLARYLDPAKDAEKFAPMDTLGWERAYRSGDHVRLEEDGLYFVGRIDDQVKIGGRRIELGEVDAALSALDNVRSGSVVVQTTGGGDKVLVGYVSPEHGTAADFDLDAALTHLRASLPAAMVPRLCALDSLPVTTSGKVDKKALPWPLPASGAEDTHFDDSEQERIARLWSDALGLEVTNPDQDFFSLGGTSLSAATMIARLRSTVPSVSVRDLYDHSRLAAFSARVAEVAEQARQDQHAQPSHNSPAHQGPVPRVRWTTRLAQALIQVPAMMLGALQWITWILFGNWALHGILGLTGQPDQPSPGDPWPFLSQIVVPVNGWLVLALFLIFATPLGRMPLAALLIRGLLAGVQPGDYPRGGATHLRLWAAERVADTSGARDVSGASWITTFARWLGADVGRGVQLHTLPPVTGMLTLGNYSSVEPEVDLSGYWVEGDTLHLGHIVIGDGATVGARSTLLPGTTIASNAHIDAGSCVTGAKKVKSGARWAGSPAKKVGKAKGTFPSEAPPRKPLWRAGYALGAVVLSILPLLSLAVGIVFVLWALSLSMQGATLQHTHSGWTILALLVPLSALGGLVIFATYTALTWILVRVLSIGLAPGVIPVRSFSGWRVWFIERLMDAARTQLFPLYAAQLTPWWFRSLGAKIGRDAEISTAVMVPTFADVRDGAFLADDTMVGGYELGGRGWMRTGTTRVGKRSFLGNSGIAGPERNLKKNSLVAVLSSTPKKTKAGSNWLGSPPERLRRTVEADTHEGRTYNPSRRVKAARGAVETLRLLAPMTSAVIAACVIAAIQYQLLAGPISLVWLPLWGALVLILAGFAAATLTVAMKWLCVGRIRPGEHELWSRFVWLNELQDQFVETVAGPWFLAHTHGTGSLNVFLRALGARIGRGAWLDTYWLPEADLVVIEDGATVGPGCVVQTHLFHDRIMSLDTVVLRAGSTLGPHSVALPASDIGRTTSVGPASLVMRGDHVPANTRWHGNPIEIRRD